MMNWNTVAVLAGVFAAAGAVFDKFLLPHTRTSLYDRLLAYWVKLDDTAYKDLAKAIASWTIRLSDRAMRGSFFSIRSILLWTAVSWLLTSAVSVTDGLFIEPEAYPLDTHPIPLPEFPAYFVNWVFDMATILMTIKVLHVVRDRSPIVGASAVLVNIVGACILYLGCITTTMFAFHHAEELRLPGTYYTNQQFESGLKDAIARETGAGRLDDEVLLTYSSTYTIGDAFSQMLKSIQYARTGRKVAHPIAYSVRLNRNGLTSEHHVDWRWHPTYLVPLVSATIFLPLIALLAVLLVVTLSKVLKDLYRYLLLHVLEVAAASDPRRQPKDFAPGTLVGVVAGLLAALAKAISVLFEV